jgi:hypothetical protein
VQRPPGLPCALCFQGGSERCKARTISVARMMMRVLRPFRGSSGVARCQTLMVRRRARGVSGRCFAPRMRRPRFHCCLKLESECLNAVVPAKAGTHNHRIVLKRRTSSTTAYHGWIPQVRVPAFAGTTYGESVLLRQRRITRLPSSALSTCDRAGPASPSSGDAVRRCCCPLRPVGAPMSSRHRCARARTA